ncbi:glycosyltransferase family 2 protein [Streptomyces peucetius]|uniref:Glycosyltransferase family 2 protein n=1 Tax=Streptomyces peucetius TaxID=1950 RepID=A0ABY6I5S8_STRPE|nr:glycosyltransferase family 2 protein [Streptomyces peucetius]UYQ62094.1 glycosyltransferase family 2 protein [Streptomyces peucetius]
MSVKVSVVIPVYNPGEYIEDCIASLLRQSLPDDEYEAIFVNDGSTDGTPERLDRLAAEHPHMHVIHQEGSGWSGKPRNVGIEAARGEYVMFVDNDDWLGDEALERMYEYGVVNKADVVIGKMAGKGRPVPLELFRVNRPRASVENAPLIDSLTPHKMVRKDFLDSSKLRFMEGRRRLEDHVFVAEAYLRASNVAVLSDYLCYYHVKREDASNAGFQRFDPVGYFKNLREALDVVERHTEPGPLRDKLFRRWLRNEMVERLRGKRLLALPEDYRKELFAEIHSVVTERFGPGVAAGMQPIQQLVAALIAADRLAEVEELARWEAGIKPTGLLESLAWEDGELQVAFTAEYEVDGRPMTFRTVNGKDMLNLPLSDSTLATVKETGVEPLATLDRAKVDLVVRERATAAEFFQPVEFTRERLPDTDGTFRSVLMAKSSVDIEGAANGAPLGAGIWDVLIRITSCGWTKETRLGALRADDVEDGREGALSGSPRRLVLPYWTEPHSNLSLDVDHATSKFDRDVAPITAKDAVLSDGRIELPLRLAVTGEEQASLRYKASGGAAAFETAATLSAGPDGTVLSALLPPELTAGAQQRIELGLPSAKRGVPRWTALPLVLGVDSDGAPRVRHAAEAAAEIKAAKAAAAKAAAAKASNRSLLRRVAGRVRRALSK